jgi:hypothetical protein
MKQGNQNDVIGKDSVHLYPPQDILPMLFPHGYMALLDASKYFHMFSWGSHTQGRTSLIGGSASPWGGPNRRPRWADLVRFGADFVRMVRKQ